ncbi:MAG: hypothetical protein BWY44_01079 [Candidatus Omnitrophica bacterium ADurb.Bin292]|nr:MAG: hypothetical protein BWY44_01079 [Candidatus Omnitrophica bacterium ADurb.Bin292]
MPHTIPDMGRRFGRDHGGPLFNFIQDRFGFLRQGFPEGFGKSAEKTEFGISDIAVNVDFQFNFFLAFERQKHRPEGIFQNFLPQGGSDKFHLPQRQDMGGPQVALVTNSPGPQIKPAPGHLTGKPVQQKFIFGNGTFFDRKLQVEIVAVGKLTFSFPREPGGRILSESSFQFNVFPELGACVSRN